jgi:hypothetical protein
LDFVNEPIALNLDHAQPQFLHVEIPLPRDLALGGEVDYRGVLVGRDDDIDVRKLDGEAANYVPRADGCLEQIVPSADGVLGPWNLHRDLHVGREELSQQAGVIGLGDQAFIGRKGSDLGQFAQTFANQRFRAGK